MIKTITKTEVNKMKLKGKPKCPSCDNPLTFVYEGAKGMLGEKCPRCKQEFLIDTETLDVFRILKAS